jgi:hypothetical protein
MAVCRILQVVEQGDFSISYNMAHETNIYEIACIHEHNIEELLNKRWCQFCSPPILFLSIAIFRFSIEFGISSLILHHIRLVICDLECIVEESYLKELIYGQ